MGADYTLVSMKILLPLVGLVKSLTRMQFGIFDRRAVTGDSIGRVLRIGEKWGQSGILDRSA